MKLAEIALRLVRLIERNFGRENATVDNIIHSSARSSLTPGTFSTVVWSVVHVLFWRKRGKGNLNFFELHQKSV